LNNKDLKNNNIFIEEISNRDESSYENIDKEKTKSPNDNSTNLNKNYDSSDSNILNQGILK